MSNAKEYRVNGFLLWKEFRELMREKGLRPEHAGVFWYFLSIANDLKWPEWFSFDWEVAVDTLNVRQNTFYKYLGKLHEAGALIWEKGNRDNSLGRIKIQNLKEYRVKRPLSKNDNGCDNGCDNSLITDNNLTDKGGSPIWKSFWHKEVLPTYGKYEPRRHEKSKIFISPTPPRNMTNAQLEKWVAEWHTKLDPLNKRLAEINGLSPKAEPEPLEIPGTENIGKI